LGVESDLCGPLRVRLGRGKRVLTRTTCDTGKGKCVVTSIASEAVVEVLSCVVSCTMIVSSKRAVMEKVSGFELCNENCVLDSVCVCVCVCVCVYEFAAVVCLSIA
jgi:hypothetical protein